MRKTARRQPTVPRSFPDALTCWRAFAAGCVSSSCQAAVHRSSRGTNCLVSRFAGPEFRMRYHRRPWLFEAQSRSAIRWSRDGTDFGTAKSPRTGKNQAVGVQIPPTSSDRVGLQTITVGCQGGGTLHRAALVGAGPLEAPQKRAWIGRRSDANSDVATFRRRPRRS